MSPWGFLSHGRQISFILFYFISFYCKQTRTKWSWFFFFFSPLACDISHISAPSASLSHALSPSVSPAHACVERRSPRNEKIFIMSFFTKPLKLSLKNCSFGEKKKGKKILLTSTSRTISPTAEDAPDFFLPRLPTTGWMDGWMDACVKRKLPQKILSRNRRCYDVHQQPWGSILHVRTLYFSLFLKF